MPTALKSTRQHDCEVVLKKEGEHMAMIKSDTWTNVMLMRAAHTLGIDVIFEHIFLYGIA